MTYRAFAILILLASTGRAADDDTVLAAFVKQHCVKCHSGKRAEAMIDLEKLTRTPIRAADFKVWRTVARVVSTQEMPPQDEPVPSAAERDRAVAVVRAALDRIARGRDGDPGAAVRGRLSHAEYDNAIRDLTGLSLNLSGTFPSDGSGGEGFTNVGSQLTVASSGAFEKYVAAARKIADHATFSADGSLRFTAFSASKVANAAPIKEVVERDLLDFARRAWRRPLSSAEQAALLKHLHDIGETGEPLDGAVRVSLIRILCSPNFLFKCERSFVGRVSRPGQGVSKTDGPGDPSYFDRSEPGKRTHPLTQHELAARLSLFLWSSIPDAELARLADEGQLAGEVVDAQIKRMLADPKSEALAIEFFGQWLGFKGFDRHAGTDQKKFPSFTTLLRQEMYLESVNFFRDLVQADRPVPDILFSDATFLSDRLVQHYQIDPATIEWPAGSPYTDAKKLASFKKDTRTVHPVYHISLGKHARGGVLGMASVLTGTSTPVRTAPSIRGKWIYESILGREIPDPPADVGTIPEETSKAASIRERLEKHRSLASCAGCHARFDPLGFALEGFDAIGRARTKDAAGRPIDDRADLANESFHGIDGLRDYLRQHQDEFLRNFASKLVGFALGRSLAPADLALIDRMVEQSARDEYRFSGFVRTLVNSPTFRQRRGADFVDHLEQE